MTVRPTRVPCMHAPQALMQATSLAIPSPTRPSILLPFLYLLLTVLFVLFLISAMSLISSTLPHQWRPLPHRPLAFPPPFSENHSACRPPSSPSSPLARGRPHTLLAARVRPTMIATTYLLRASRARVSAPSEPQNPTRAPTPSRGVVPSQKLRNAPQRLPPADVTVARKCTNVR